MKQKMTIMMADKTFNFYISNNDIVKREKPEIMNNISILNFVTVYNFCVLFVKLTYHLSNNVKLVEIAKFNIFF